MYTIENLTINDSKDALLIAVMYYRRVGWTLQLKEYCNKYSLDFLKIVTIAELIDDIPKD